MKLKDIGIIAIVLVSVTALGCVENKSPTQAPSTHTTQAANLIATPTSQPTFTDSMGMEFMLIPTGEFDMGSPLSEEDRYDDEGPVHNVKISKAFYLGKYEVTQRQWREIMGNNPSNFKGDDFPVEQVSWNDVQDFIRKINAKENTNTYRLPSEAEWEYAARAGTKTRYFFGDDENNLGEYAWYKDNPGDKTHEVGKKKPNQWGLYDIYGNVWEWTQDEYHYGYANAPSDGSVWKNIGENHLIYPIYRGCSWSSFASYCRSARRSSHTTTTDHRSTTLGFRLVKEFIP